MKKLIDFSEELGKEIQKHADAEHRKNFTAAVNEMCSKQVKLNKQKSKGDEDGK